MVETEDWPLSEIGKIILNSNDILLPPKYELMLRVLGMMGRPTSAWNILDITDYLVSVFGSVEDAIEALIQGCVELRWIWPI